jgi:hypothetical protein
VLSGPQQLSRQRLCVLVDTCLEALRGLINGFAPKPQAGVTGIHDIYGWRGSHAWL